MALEAMWVPGNVVVAEWAGPSRFSNVSGVAWTDVLGLRRGWGVTYRGKANTSNWFHAQIPTPVIANNVRVKLQRIFVFYNIQTWAQVTSVHVWDGPNRIWTRDGLAVTGNRSASIQDGQNSWAIPTPWIFWGVGISVLVRFGPSDADITFTTAGADFITH